jgi:hypothetical protein
LGDFTAMVVDSLKVLDPKRPIREADIARRSYCVRLVAKPGSRRVIRQAYGASASSSVLASFRSSVSKPSVNQP